MSPLHLGLPAASGPALRRSDSLHRATALQGLALAMPLVASLIQRGPDLTSVLLAALAAALGAEALFARIRRHGPSLHGLTTALIVTLMAPQDVAVWQVLLAVLFGAVIGELVFGGRGFGVMNAGLAALAFLGFSFPGQALSGADPVVALAALPGGALLLWAGLISGRVLLGLGAGFAATTALTGLALDPVQLLAILALPTIFLVADPLGAAVTNPGRWIYGALAGGLAALFLDGAPPGGGPQALVSAALMAAIMAPLIDEVALRASRALGRRAP